MSKMSADGPPRGARPPRGGRARSDHGGDDTRRRTLKRAAATTRAPLADPPATVARRTEGARVLEWIKRAILDVAFVPGAALSEAAIATRFGLSRTPVREAILKLADEGWIDVRPQRGTYVARLSLARVEEALFVRQAVECAILERVVARKDRRDVARALAAIVDAQAEAIRAGDIGAALAADTRFHRALVEASGLPGVWDAVALARDHHQRIRAIAVPELGSAAQAIRDHRAIVRALAGGDAARAQRAMREHLAHNLDLARTIAARHPDYFERADGSGS